MTTVSHDSNADLKGSMEAQQSFRKHQHHLGKFTAYMLGIASQSGNMSEIYEATARFLERQNEFNKSIRSAMITPAITTLVLMATFVWYVWYKIGRASCRERVSSSAAAVRANDTRET